MSCCRGLARGSRPGGWWGNGGSAPGAGSISRQGLFQGVNRVAQKVPGRWRCGPVSGCNSEPWQPNLNRFVHDAFPGEDAKGRCCWLYRISQKCGQASCRPAPGAIQARQPRGRLGRDGWGRWLLRVILPSLFRRCSWGAQHRRLMRVVSH